MEVKLEYGNWIRKKNLMILGVCALAMGMLSFVPLGPFYRLVTTVLFVILLVSFLFPLYSYVMFSQQGGGFQDKLYGLIIQRLGKDVKGRVLDIGSGNGVLAVKLACANTEAEVLGIDYWGPDWEYSKQVCEKNAKAAGVEARVHFQKGDAAALDFPSNTFDAVTSNLTFHEVRSVPDTRAVVREALRVVQPGGSFAVIDYFYEEKCYGEKLDFEHFLQELGLAQFDVQPISELIAIPALLKHPRILGKVGMISGRK
ncbi:MAG: class I SAM-dependent methyltransferase [Bacteroidota bacterium]